MLLQVSSKRRGSEAISEGRLQLKRAALNFPSCHYHNNWTHTQGSRRRHPVTLTGNVCEQTEETVCNKQTAGDDKLKNRRENVEKWM